MCYNNHGQVNLGALYAFLQIIAPFIGLKQPKILGAAASHGSREISKNSSGHEKLKDHALL